MGWRIDACKILYPELAKDCIKSWLNSFSFFFVKVNENVIKISLRNNMEQLNKYALIKSENEGYCT